MVDTRIVVILLVASGVYYYLHNNYNYSSLLYPSSTPRLSYFSARGITEPIRLLLKDANVEYISNDLGASVNGTPAEKFVELRATGVLDYGSVPLWEEDGLKLVQSYAIIRHLARKYGYNGNNEIEESKIDSVVEGVKDFNLAIRKILTTAPEQKTQVWNTIVTVDIPKWLGFLEALLKKSGTGYFVGNKASYADFYVVSLTEELRDHKLGLENYPLLSSHLSFIHSRPGIAAHLASPSRFPSSFSRFIPK